MARGCGRRFIHALGTQFALRACDAGSHAPVIPSTVLHSAITIHHGHIVDCRWLSVPLEFKDTHLKLHFIPQSFSDRSRANDS